MGLTRWALARDVAGLFEFSFMVNALRAGTVVAVLAGLVGWFMVARRESFAGHTFAVVGFAGAAGAELAGIDVAIGYLGTGLLAAVVIARLPAAGGGGSDGGRRAGRGGGHGGHGGHGGGGGSAGTVGGFGRQSAGVGTVQALALATGYLFSSLYGGLLSGTSALLFGSILGVTDAQLVLLLAVAAGCVAGLAVLGRPLLFASVDPVLARARGVPVTAVSTAFLLILALAATSTAQVTGSLLVFALLVAPAAAAHRLTARPARGLALSVLIALGVTWLGEGISYYSPYPVGFWVSSLGFGAYLLAVLVTAVAARVPGGRARLDTGTAAR